MFWTILLKIFLVRRYPYQGFCQCCNKNFNYMRYSGMSLLYPHFYCSQCPNVVRRESDFDKVMRSDLTEALLHEIIESLPKCLCGGDFILTAGPKCPYCKKEFMQSSTDVSRLSDPYLVLVQGAKLFNKYK